jgi:threonine dehydrogenase-like Zn-dependent dehydrogenase
MRAAVVVAPRRLELTSVDVPAPGDGQVLIRLDGCGICGSDLAVWEGRPWFEYPLAAGRPGHEAWGTVEALGAGVTGVHEGQRVAGLGYNGFADFDVADASALVRLPDDLDGPFPGEAIGCVMNIFERSDIQEGDTVAIVGVGFLGALLIQLAAARGARVVAISRRGFALSTATACGAKETIELDGDPVERVRELTGGSMCDVAIEATGHQSALDVAAELVRIRGRLVIAGFHQDGPRTVNMQSWNWRGIDVINAHERETSVYVRGIAAAVTAVADGVIDLRRVITHALPLEQLGTALDLALERPDGFVKAVVER